MEKVVAIKQLRLGNDAATKQLRLAIVGVLTLVVTATREIPSNTRVYPENLGCVETNFKNIITKKWKISRHRATLDLNILR